MKYRLRYHRGYTLIEVIMVIIIIGILGAIAMKSVGKAVDAGRAAETIDELELLAHAIAGNPELVSGGTRTDFGYVGDVGAMPPGLDALLTNPGGYSTWNGPYIQNDFSNGSGGNSFKLDGWGREYVYSGGNSISSIGGGSAITRMIANSVGDLLYNRVTACIFDFDNTPPGIIYKDSIEFRLTFPDGAGFATTLIGYPNANGLVEFDTIPIGIHDLSVIVPPGTNIIRRKIVVNPGKDSYTDIQHFADVW